MRRQDFVAAINRLPGGSLWCDTSDRMGQMSAMRRVANAGRWTLEDLTHIPSDLRACIGELGTSPLSRLAELPTPKGELWRIDPSDERWTLYLVHQPPLYPWVVVLERGQVAWTLHNVGPAQLSFHLRGMLRS